MRSTLRNSIPFAAAILAGLGTTSTTGQVLLDEKFTGGASTTGFTVVPGPETVCNWLYAPGGITEQTFTLDGGGSIPSGSGFDGDFAFIDSDVCGTTNGIVVISTLVSAPFDASGANMLMLSFSHQFQARLQSFCKVEVFNGSVWTEIVTYTGTSVGYPNPAATATFDITTAAGGSAAAQVRFEFNASWDWWWALDDIQVTNVNCLPPTGLAVTNPGMAGAGISFTENGSTGYEWVVTAGGAPNGSNAVASGTANNSGASGLQPGTQYSAFVRANCAGGGISLWSPAVTFWTTIVNNECLNAVPLTVNADYDCAVKTSGTVSGATASNVTSSCAGTADDDVWFKFVASTTTHRVSLTDVSGSVTDLYHAVWTGDCTGLNLVPNSCSDGNQSDPTGLTAGTTYYVQVYTYTAEVGQNTGFKVCIGTDPAIGITEQGPFATMRVFPNPVRDQLSIDLSDSNARRLLIVDAAGRTVSEHVFQRTIDVNSLDAGTYALIAFDRDARVIARSLFVKE